MRDGFIRQGDGNWWSTHSLKVSVIEHIAEFADQVGSNLHEFGSSGMPRWGTEVCESGNERHTAITGLPDSPVCGAALHALVHCPGPVHWMHLHAHRRQIDGCVPLFVQRIADLALANAQLSFFSSSSPMTLNGA